MLLSRQQHGVRVGSRRVDAAWRSRFMHGACHPERPGLHQQLRCGRWRRTPFGGVKSSGYGREKGFGSPVWFSVMKTVVVRHG